ncbi:site-specific integrase [Deinococcus sp. 6GRE01]|uniref:tyrosine-type recombinase/integrase n=1 Tax=Deinococcus sp. 6GRE01 TaxID=2745873 RepID=UPI001E4A311C|nr:site-specific integrase [Deinococcus sp. 6GRE01]
MAPEQNPPTPMRRRVGSGTLHAIRTDGRITAWRGLASYRDPNTGLRRRKSVTRATRREAEAALRAFLSTLPTSPRVSRARASAVALPAAEREDTLLGFLNTWLAFRRQDLRPTTYRTYVSELLHLTPDLGHVQLASLTPMQIQQVVTQRLVHGVSTAKSLARALRTLRMALRQAVLWGVLPSNPALMVRAPRTRPTDMKVWTPAETRQFLQYVQPHRLHPLFHLALSTGMRRGELLGLSWQDINFTRQQLTVCQNYIREVTGEWILGEPKTPAGHRVIPLADDTLQLLRDHRREEQRWFGPRRGHHPVFTRASGSRVDPNNVGRLFRRLIGESGVPRIRFHDLRHTAASLMIRQGVPAKVVSDRLGHADVAFTLSIYTHLYEDQRRSAALNMDQLLAAAPDRPESETRDLMTQLQQLLTALRGEEEGQRAGSPVGEDRLE